MYKGNKTYFINKKNKKVKVKEYELSGGLSNITWIKPSIKNVVKINGKYELIYSYFQQENNEEQIIKIDTSNLKIDTIIDVDGPLIICKNDNKYALLNPKDLKIIINDSNESLIKQTRSSKSKPIEPNYIYDFIDYPNRPEGGKCTHYLKFRKGNQFGIMSKSGEVFVAAQYLSIENAQTFAYALVQYEKEKYGFIRFSFTKNDKGHYPIEEYSVR